MLTHIRLSRTLVAAVLAFSAACGGDATSPQLSLTDAESAEMFSTLFGIGGFDGGTALKIATPTRDAAVNLTVNCPAGGTAVVTGSSTDGTTGTSVSVTQQYNNCKNTAMASGKTWTFNGSLTFAGTLQTSGAVNATMRGSVSTSNGTKSGACPIDITISLAASGGAGGVTGSICGKALSGALGG